ncbi:uncharacterized protein LOC124461344 [Drosophila willistoni]|uniref:uncharacterized protein LOC124461344 n=1 Tax=Drosophila willistoni TaxID=7260 RepID=UPI001F0801ED|nr:uncharacterized protein LOC124461344 [Drosophila willistoni]
MNGTEYAAPIRSVEGVLYVKRDNKAVLFGASFPSCSFDGAAGNANHLADCVNGGSCLAKTELICRETAALVDVGVKSRSDEAFKHLAYRVHQAYRSIGGGGICWLPRLRQEGQLLGLPLLGEDSLGEAAIEDGCKDIWSKRQGQFYGAVWDPIWAWCFAELE